MLRRLKFSILIMLIFVGALFTGCSSASENQEDVFQEGTKNVLISIDYKGNLFLAKDNLDIFIDNHKFYTVENGDTNINYYSLTNGEHSLKVSAGFLHSKSIKFTVENQGDIFEFSVKNHPNKVEIWATFSGNFYKMSGMEIPEDEQSPINQEQMESIKKPSSVWSKIWSVVKPILIFFGIAIVFVMVGYLINGVFSAINMQKMGLVTELALLIVFAVKDKFGILSIMIVIGFIAMNIILMGKLRNISTEFQTFSVIKEATNNAWAFSLSYICPAFILIFPQVTEKLPFTIHNINTYVYIYIIICVLFPLFAMDEDLEFPKKMKAYIKSKEIITLENIEEYVHGITKSDDTEDDIKKKEEKVFTTLSDFVEIGILQEDNESRCYRRLK